VVLLKAEMERTERFFGYCTTKWKELSGSGSAGYSAYCKRMSSAYTTMKEDAYRCIVAAGNANVPS
jgi:hypothetical protein